jgi:hypothetical protein
MLLFFGWILITILPVDFLVDAANMPCEKLKNGHFHLGWKRPGRSVEMNCQLMDSPWRSMNNVAKTSESCLAK